MPTTAGIALIVVAGVCASIAACAPPIPKAQQWPAAVPQGIEQTPQTPVREVDPSLRPMVREESTTPLRHG